MKCLTLAIMLSACCITIAYAASDRQVETIKALYQQAKAQQQGMEILEKYADNSLAQAFKVKAQNGEVCGTDHDVVWQSQDPEYDRKLTFTKLGNNRVKVNLAKGQWHEPSSVVYQLKCKGNHCQVSDVIEGRNSLKQDILDECS